MAQKKLRNHSPEFREAAAREVVDKSRAAVDVAADCGVTAQTIRNWVKELREAGGESEPDLSISERARLKELERRVRELEEENLFLGKSVASSRINTGECEIRVHRCGRRLPFGREYVPVGEGFEVGVLRLAYSKTL